MPHAQDSSLPSNAVREKLRNRERELQHELQAVRKQLRKTRGQFDWMFKSLLVFIAVTVILGIGSTERVQYLLRSLSHQARVERNAGRIRTIEEKIDEVEAGLDLAMEPRMTAQKRIVNDAYENASPERQAFLKQIGLASEGTIVERAVIGRGINLGWVASLSGRVFERENENDLNRSPLPFVLRPVTRARWFIPSNPLAHMGLSVPLLPSNTLVDAGVQSGVVPGLVECALVDAIHTTNSVGLRGPEPNPQADLRVLVLGDSFMHGYGVGDEHTPPMFLQRYLEKHSGQSVSVLNTGVSGYGLKEYLLSLEIHSCGFRPHVVIVSVCGNDFGSATAVYNGAGEDWERAGYYLRRIWIKCEELSSLCLFCPVPERELLFRRNKSYMDRIARELRNVPSIAFCQTLDSMALENFRLESQQGLEKRGVRSYVHLDEIGDGHLSPAGASVWGREIGEHVLILRNSTTKTLEPEP